MRQREGERDWSRRAGPQRQGAGGKRRARSSGGKHGTRGTTGRWWAKKRSAQWTTRRVGQRGQQGGGKGTTSPAGLQNAKEPH